MKSTVRAIIGLLCLGAVALCSLSMEARAEEWKDENSQRMENALGIDEDGNYFEIGDEAGIVGGETGDSSRTEKSTVKIVNFNTKGNAVTNYTEYETKNQGYTNGAYGADAAYLGKEDGKVIFMLAGVKGKVNASEVEVIDYSKAKSVSYYIVSDGKLLHRITGNLTKTNYSSINNGNAPSYLKEDVKYYSYDGHYFYKSYSALCQDYQNGTRENSVNPKKPYYNYYQFLPMRSRTEYTADQIYSILNERLSSKGYSSISKLKNRGRNFVEYQNQYGVNALMMLSVAVNESNWGTSDICMKKNNIFGLNAVDSSPGASANTYASIQACIKQFAETYMSKRYLRPGYIYYNGGYVGNKASGINVKYASDPYWGEKAAAVAYTLDSAGGNKDNGRYTIGIKDAFSKDSEGRSDVNVRAGSATSTPSLYKTSSVADYAVLLRNTKKDNNFYQIQSDAVINSDRTAVDTTTGKYNYKNMYAYMYSDYVDIVHEGKDITLFSLATPKNVSAEYKNGKVTFKWEKVSNAKGYYVYRKVDGGSYSRIKVIESGDTLSYTDSSVKENKKYTYTVRAYNKSIWSSYYTAGVSVETIKQSEQPGDQEKPENPDNPEQPEVTVTYTKYRVINSDLNYRSGPGKTFDIVDILPKGTVISVEDGYSKKADDVTWVRFKLESESYYVSKAYLEKVIELSKPGLVSVKYENNKITFKWKKVTNAKGYYVYRKLSGGSFKKIATIKSGTTLTYKDSNITKGKTYVYTVKAYNGNNVSGYNTTGLKIKASPAKTYTKYVTTTGVNYRNGAGTSYAKKGTLNKGTVISVEDGYSKKADGYTWVRFKMNSKTYYVTKKYLKKK